MGKAGVSCCQSHRQHNQHSTRLLQVRVTCETKLAHIQAPNTHLRPEECASALWVLHLLLSHFICRPPAPAHRLTPLAPSSWARCRDLWNTSPSNKKLFPCLRKITTHGGFIYCWRCIYGKRLARWHISTLELVTNTYVSKGWQQVEKDVPRLRHNGNRMKGAKKFLTLNLWWNSLVCFLFCLFCFLPHSRLLRCQGRVAGVRVKTRTGQPDQSQQVSIRSPASGG